MSKLGQMERGAATAPPPENVNLAAALRLATVGIPVLPVNDKKKPLLKNWPIRSTQVRDEVIAYWQCHPTALPGINCGMAGLVVVDADRRDSVDGVVAFERLAEKNGQDLSKVPAIDTPGGGRHYFFRNMAERPLGNSTGGLPPRIDIRGAGGMVVAVGATLPDGRKYLETPGSPDLIAAFESNQIPLVPEWLVDLIELAKLPAGRQIQADMRDTRPVRSDAHPPAGVSAEPTVVKRGKAAANVALAECVQQVANAKSGNRNNTLNAVAFRLGRFVAAKWILRQTVEHELVHASRLCGLVEDDAIDSVVHTIRSGLSKGQEKGPPTMKDRIKFQENTMDAVGLEKYMWHQAIMEKGGYAPTVYQLAGLVFHFYRKSGQYVDIASRFFATKMGVDRSSVVRALNVLVREGWLIPDGAGRSRASRFRLGRPDIQK